MNVALVECAYSLCTLMSFLYGGLAGKKVMGKGTKAFSLILSNTGEVFKQHFSACMDDDGWMDQVLQLQRALGYRIKVLFIDNADSNKVKKIRAKCDIPHVLQVHVSSLVLMQCYLPLLRPC